MSGLNYVLTSTRSSSRPSVVNLSIGGSVSLVLDNAVAAVSLHSFILDFLFLIPVLQLTGAGIHVTVGINYKSSEDQP